jgi:hypothetical protein
MTQEQREDTQGNIALKREKGYKRIQVFCNGKGNLLSMKQKKTEDRSGFDGFCSFVIGGDFEYEVIEYEIDPEDLETMEELYSDSGTT